MLTDILIQNGLSKKEADLYLATLQAGEMTVSPSTGGRGSKQAQWRRVDHQAIMQSSPGKQSGKRGRGGDDPSAGGGRMDRSRQGSSSDRFQAQARHQRLSLKGQAHASSADEDAELEEALKRSLLET